MDLFWQPDTAISWLMGKDGISNQKSTERTKEERVERFWRGLSIVGGVAFFVGYIIQRKASQ